jgi:peptidoglycan/LPS O-acetylase OafA/YrhL
MRPSSGDSSLGLVRLFLAWVVAADHWSVFILRPQSIPLEDQYKFGFNAGYAVMFFYVVSGFLITYTLTRNYDRDLRGTFKFYKNRFIRIFSLYWPLVVLTFLLFGWAWTRFLAASLPDKLTGIFLLAMDWRLAFADFPKVHFDAAIGGLHQAWTLGAELTFYLAAPLLMRSWKIGAMLLAVSFGVRAAFVIALGNDVHEIWTYHFAVTTFGFFMLGHLVCLAGHRWRRLSQPVVGYVLLVCSFATMLFGGSYAGFDTTRFWGSVLLFAVALPGLFEATKGMRWLNLAGDLSYPIYLVHTGVLILFGPALLDFALPLTLLPPVEAAYVSIAAFLGLTTLAALVVHRLIEVPVAHAMHRIVGRPALRPLL